MKREIKFKAKVKGQDRYVVGVPICIYPQNFDFKNFDSMQFVENGELKTEYIDSETLSQFTGLKDKNGVEIYENDYLIDKYTDEDTGEIIESYMPVIWCDKELRFKLDVSFKKDSSYLVSITDYFGEFLEVKSLK